MHTKNEDALKLKTCTRLAVSNTIATSHMWLVVSLFVAILKFFKLPIMLFSKESRFLLLLHFLEDTNYIDILPNFSIHT